MGRSRDESNGRPGSVEILICFHTLYDKQSDLLGILEFAPFHIRCNSVAPGAIETNMYATSFSEEHKARTLSKIPMGVLGQAEDVAETIIFLASPEASYVSGAMFGVHGGAVTS